MSKFLISFVIIFVFFKLLVTFSNMYLADTLSDESETLLENSKLTSSLEKINEAIILNPQEPSYYRQRARVYITLNLLPDQNHQINKLLAFEDLIYAESLNSVNIATLRNAIPLYYFLALGSLNGGDSPENLDSEYLESTKNYYSRLKQTYPRDAGVIAAVAKYEKRLGLIEEYNDSVNRIRELRPDLLEWHESFK